MLGSALLCQAHEASKAHAAVLVQLEDQEQALMEAREAEAKVKKDNRKIHARVQELEAKLHGWESPGKKGVSEHLPVYFLHAGSDCLHYTQAHRV